MVVICTNTVAELPLYMQRSTGLGASKSYMGWVGNDIKAGEVFESR